MEGDFLFSKEGRNEIQAHLEAQNNMKTKRYLRQMQWPLASALVHSNV